MPTIDLPSISGLHALSISMEAIGQLFLVALLGFMFVRRRILSDEHLKGLTRIMIDAIVPCALAYAMIRNFSMEVMAQAAPLILFLACIIPITAIVTLLMLRLWPGASTKSDGAIAALASMPNSFYVPFPLALAIVPLELEPVAKVLVGACVLAVNPLQWTLGTWLVMGSKEGVQHDTRSIGESLRHTLNGPVIGIVGGTILAFVPGFREAAMGAPGSWAPLRVVLSSMEMIGRAMAPLAMIITGGLIGACRIGKSFKLRTLLPILGMRFVVVPAIALWYFRTFVPAAPGIAIVGFILMLEAASPPAMNLALVARRYDADWETISSVQVIASVAALVALPIWMTIGLTM